MGTRNLTAVFYNGEYKVAQYGQWDGYLSRAGEAILKQVHRLSESTVLEKFKINLNKCYWMSEKDCKDAYAPYTDDKGLMTVDQSREFQSTEKGQWMTRDLGYDVIEKIIDFDGEEIPLINKIDFAKDSLFCEYAYVIDLDIGTFEIYKGFNTEPIEQWERFFTDELYSPDYRKQQYTPVKLMALYDLENIPENLSALDNDLSSDKCYTEKLNPSNRKKEMNNE